MPEEFGLQQLRREGCTVEDDEGTAAPRAVFMDGAGTDFLTCPGFSQKENTYVGSSYSADILEDLDPCRRVADELRS
jgi:hypothetical protein